MQLSNNTKKEVAAYITQELDRVLAEPGCEWESREKFLKHYIDQIRTAFWHRYSVRRRFLLDVRRKQPIGAVLDKKTGKPKEVFAFQCSCCSNWFREGDIQVDHIDPIGAISLENFSSYLFEGILTPYSNMQVLCKVPCHKAKTYSERNGVSLTDALSLMPVMSLIKTSAKTAAQKSFIKEFNVPHNPDDLTNSTKRSAVIRKFALTHDLTHLQNEFG